MAAEKKHRVLYNDILRARWRRGLLCAPITVLIPIQFFGAIPLQLYLGNAEELNIPLGSVLLYCAAFFVLSAVFLTLLGLAFSNKAFSGYCAVLFACGVLLYLQSNFLFINVGVLNGQDVDLSSYTGQIKANLLLWVGAIVAAILLTWILPRFTEKITRYGALALSAMQVLVIVLLFVMPGQGRETTEQSFIVSAKGFDELSSDKNAVMIIMDMFDDTYMTEVLEKNPDIAERLEGFVRYTNATGKYSSTSYGLPYLITQQPLLNQGENYQGMLEHVYSNSEQLNRLKENGYRIQLYTGKPYISNTFRENCYNILSDGQYVISDLFDFCKLMTKFTLLRSGPDILKTRMLISTDQFDRVVSAKENEVYAQSGIQPYQKMMNDAIQTVKEPIFSVIHIKGAHPPYVINENAEEVPKGSVTYYEQAVGTMRTVAAYLDHMKEAGVYDNSTIILTADHGYYSSGAVTCPALLVKNKGSRGELTYDDAPVSHDNIQDFILGDAGIGYTPEPKKGQRIFYSYALIQNGYEYELTEWHVSDRSNARESFTWSGYKIDLNGNREPVSQYLPYQLGESIYFGNDGNAEDYFDYGTGDKYKYSTMIMDSESKMTLTHAPASKDMLLSVGIENSQTSDCTITAICNGVNCGEAVLKAGQFLARWKIPAECMSEGQTEIILRFEGVEQNWYGTVERLLYHSFAISEYKGEDLSSEAYVIAALQDYQSQILSYEFSENDLLVTVKNTSSVNWTYQDQVKCYLRVDGEDRGIRAYLDPLNVVKPGGEVEFRFTNLDITTLSKSHVEVQMLQEGFAYFGDSMEIRLDTQDMIEKKS